MMLADAAHAIIDALDELGIDATLDARDLNPPAALVIPTAHRYTLACGQTDVRVYLVAPNVGTRQAFELLDRLAELARPMTGDELRVESLTIPAGGDPLPAYAFTVTVEHTDT